MRLILLNYLLFHLVLSTTAHDGCSQKCQSSAAEPDDPKSPPLFPCSCSPSCSIYRDCCYDSKYRDSNRTVKQSETMCLTVEGAGRFRAVAKCPAHWDGSNQFCGESIGHLPPVTSKATGVTYANVHCAVCHEDGDDLVTWNVELRCCKEHETIRDRYFSYRQNHLWGVLPEGGGRCLCRYHPHYNDTGFLAGLELRRCGDRNREISSCSYSWVGGGDDTARLCRRYRDPVYVGQHVFKNRHCAKCNFKDDIQCVPSVVARMFSEGANLTEIARHCRDRKLKVCLYYMSTMGKGFEYSFSRLVSIDTSSCVPDPGERCCKGQVYHFKSKKCRELH